jgi:hypothetical protein
LIEPSIALWNTFTRLTLASKQGCERVALDVHVMFDAAGNGVPWDNLVSGTLG